MRALDRVDASTGIAPTPRAYLIDAFELIGRRFGDWSRELQVSDARCVARFARLDSHQFAVDLHVNRYRVCHCRIQLKFKGALEGISYSDGSGGTTDSFIESFSAERLGELYRLRPLGIRLWRLRDRQLTAEEGAWTYWQMLTAPNRSCMTGSI